MEKTAFIRKTFFVLGGLLIWAAHFGNVYVFNALACARGFHRLHLFGVGAVPLTVGLATAIALAGVIGVLVIALRIPGTNDARAPSADFLRSLTAAVALLSLLAIGWSGLPALVVPPCG